MKGLTLKSVHVGSMLLMLSNGMRQLFSGIGGVLPWKYHAHNECSSR